MKVDLPHPESAAIPTITGAASPFYHFPLTAESI